MKKLILTAISTLMCLINFAQEVKPCLFIGRYDKEKKGIVCSDRDWAHEGVMDYKEYEQIRKQFKEEHKTDNSDPVFISEKESVIVYESKKDSWFQMLKPNK